VNKLLGAVAVFTVVLGAEYAFADSTHICQGNSCNQGTNNHIEGNQNNTTINKPVARGGDADARARAASKSESKAQAGAAALATQSYEGSQTGTYTGSNNTQIGGTNFDRYAPPAYAPGLTSAGTGVCLGSMSIGASGPMAGLSFGITKVDKGCERRSGAALLYQMGYSEAAIKLLSNDPEIREALGLPPQAKATETVASQPVSPAMIQGGN